jgi:type VI secretion system protein ImpL
VEEAEGGPRERQAGGGVVQSAAKEQTECRTTARCGSGSRNAIGTLKAQRRSGHSLYDLPWYVDHRRTRFGKTTALVNSGLHFPLEQSGSVSACAARRHAQLRLVVHRRGGLPRHRGPLHTQDSDRGRRQRRLAEFLALLRKYRRRRPLNGILLTISAQDLMQGSTAPGVAHRRGRRRLNELNSRAPRASCPSM